MWYTQPKQFDKFFILQLEKSLKKVKKLKKKVKKY